VRLRNSGWSFNLLLINYKGVGRSQLEMVIESGLRTLSKKSATSTAAEPESARRALYSLLSKKRSNSRSNGLELVSAAFNATKESGRTIDSELVFPSSD